LENEALLYLTLWQDDIDIVYPLMNPDFCLNMLP